MLSGGNGGGGGGGMGRGVGGGCRGVGVGLSSMRQTMGAPSRSVIDTRGWSRRTHPLVADRLVTVVSKGTCPRFQHTPRMVPHTSRDHGTRQQ